MKMFVVRPDDEVFEVYLGNTYINTADHDSHGWDGMALLEETVGRIAEIAGWEVVTLEGEEAEEFVDSMYKE